MTVPSYITAQDLANALGTPAFMAIYDDSPTVGVFATVAAQPNVTDVLRRSLVQVASFLPDIYSKFPPETGAAGVSTGGDSIPALLKDAQLQMAIIYSYRRRPEYVKTYNAEPGGALMKEWLAFMTRLQSGTQQVTPNDSPPQTRMNTGGYTLADGARIITTGLDGTNNSGDW